MKADIVELVRQRKQGSPLYLGNDRKEDLEILRCGWLLSNTLEVAEETTEAVDGSEDRDQAIN